MKGILGNFRLAVLIGFVVIVVFGSIEPNLTCFAGGLIAGFLVNQGMRKGAFAGSLAGICGGSLLILYGMTLGGSFFINTIGGVPLLSAFGVFLIVSLTAYAAVLAAVGGIVGGAILSVL